MTTPVERPVSPWEQAGASQRAAVADACAVLVTGRDPLAAAHVALGIARAESARRRVAVADLVGDVPPLVALVDADDAHGIVDSFLYGVSLNKVARPVAGADNLFVLPSGTEPVVTEEIFRSDRWRRLAGGFREVGALLLLVAPADAAGLDGLAAMLDGVVTVGDDVGTLPLGGVPVLASVVSAHPQESGARRGTTFDMPAVALPAAADAPASAAPAAEPRTDGRRREPRTGRGRAPVVLPSSAVSGGPPRWVAPLVVLLVLAVAGTGAWWLRERDATPTRAAAPRLRDTTTSAAGEIASPRDSVRDTLQLAPLVVVNPDDSAAAATWAVEVAKFNTEDGARAGFQAAARLPAATWFPMRLSNDPGRWYRVAGGGWASRETADSVRAALGAAGAIPPTASLLRAPLALLVGRALGADSLRARSARYAQQGVAVYALRQADGTHNLYAGAFETPDQSMFLAQALTQMGDVPTLVYRTGRAP